MNIVTCTLADDGITFPLIAVKDAAIARLIAADADAFFVSIKGLTGGAWVEAVYKSAYADVADNTIYTGVEPSFTVWYNISYNDNN